MMINKNYPSCRLQLVQKTVLTLNDINIKNSLWPSKKTLLQNFRDKHNKQPNVPSLPDKLFKMGRSCIIIHNNLKKGGKF
jgi:hypothetical protein